MTSVDLGGPVYTVTYVSHGNAGAGTWGYCTSPWESEPTIVLDRTLRGRKRLEMTLHELLHGAIWFADEQWVHRVALSMAVVLWADGWRRTK